jgi:hypothetical protein
MVHAMHDAVGTGTHIGSALEYIGDYKEYTLPTLAHLESAVSCVAMLEKGLPKQGQIPDSYKEYENGHNVVPFNKGLKQFDKQQSI